MIKSVDSTIPMVINTIGQINALSNTLSGTNFWNRIGNSINMENLHFKGAIQLSGNVQTQLDFATIMVVLDKNPQTAPAINDIIADFDASGGQNTNPLSSKNPNFEERYEIVWRKNFVLPPTATNPVGPTHSNVYLFDEHINLNNVRASYQGTTTTPTVNQLIAVTLGSISAGSEGYALDMIARLEFNDY